MKFKSFYVTIIARLPHHHHMIIFANLHLITAEEQPKITQVSFKWLQIEGDWTSTISSNIITFIITQSRTRKNVLHTHTIPIVSILVTTIHCQKIIKQKKSVKLSSRNRIEAIFCCFIIIIMVPWFLLHPLSLPLALNFLFDRTR